MHNELRRTHHAFDAEMKLREANEAYHNGNPIMSDADYDTLWRSHASARAATQDDPFWSDTILDKIGAPAPLQSGFEKVKHAVRMESLDNAFADPAGGVGAVTQWLARLGLGDQANKCRIVIEPKIDGLSLRLTYINNKFVRAVTRGNGEIGDDVTANVLAAELVPLTLGDVHDGDFGDPAELLINGEVFMTYGSFAHLNVMQRKAGEEEYSNPRNAAAGIIRRKNPADVRHQGLSFLAHGIAAGHVEDDYAVEVERLQRLGLRFPESRMMLANGRVPSWVTETVDLPWLQDIAKQAYPTDGAVLKVSSFKLRNQLGSTSRAPRWAVAFKFEQEEAITTLKSITVQVGRSGILAPVAELEPVEIDGSVVSRATLHNEDHINRLGLRENMQVYVRKAAGVIPEIVRAVTPERVKTGRPEAYTPPEHSYNDAHAASEPPSDVDARLDLMPDIAAVENKLRFDLVAHIGGKCPSCGSSDIQKQEIVQVGRAIGKSTNLPKLLQVAWRCNNSAGCPAQLAGLLEHMAGRDCLNLSQMGSELCEEIAFRAGLEIDNFTHPFDLFTVPPAWFAGLSWTTESGSKMTFGAARAKTLDAAMAAALKLPLNRWIAALGIHTIGKNTSKEIARLFNSSAQLAENCTQEKGVVYRMVHSLRTDPKKVIYEELKALYGISHHLGPVSLINLSDFVCSSIGKHALMRIPETVVSDNYCPDPTTRQTTTGPLNDLTFVVTGTLSVPRKDIQAIIEGAGGVMNDSLSSKTNVLVAGEKAGSKLAKAEKLGVAIWTEEKLREEVGL